MRKSVSPKYGHGTEALIAATVEMLDERDVDQITVTTVVERAGVSRPTFYAAFPDLGAAFEAAATERLGAAFASIRFDGVERQNWSAAIGDALREVVTALVIHRVFYRRILEGPASLQCQRQMVAFVAERLRSVSPMSGPLAVGPMPLHMSTAAIAAGAVWLIADWLLRTESPSDAEVVQVADLARDFVLGSVLGGLGCSEAAPAVT